MALGGIGGVMLAGYTLFCVLAKRLHQPFKQAVCDDPASATSNAPWITYAVLNPLSR